MTDVVEKMQKFLNGLTDQECQDAYALMAAIRGPDDLNEDIKIGYTARLRGLLFGAEGTNRCKGVMIKKSLTVKQLAELERLLQKATKGYYDAKTKRTKQKLQVVRHYLRHMRYAMEVLEELKLLKDEEP